MPEQKRTEDAIADPSRQFETPMDVLRDTRLDVDAKRAILESWKKDAELLSTATNENMTGGENPLPILQQVTIALEKLEETSGRIN
ncbi:MAG TPA: hypothetical protein PKE27_22915 [Povalibacter sp.]|uniref:hypothetical protein n=1 Tax=Povalibacter sp. TaxID=1962978 RepID=UPI002BEDA941|nr:hypothetical protein [Povalibacter sp.]HMN47443.1 hypothetical protein [Povalibacter sp.]